MKGRRVLQVGVVSGALLAATHCAGAQNWIATLAPTNNWRAIACSADGSKLVAAVFGGGIYTSADSGSNWTPTTAPNGDWVAVASSADGIKLVAASGFDLPGKIYTSTDSGSNWMTNNLPSRAWQAVASSADGTRLVAVSTALIIPSLPGGMFLSTNSGADWLPANFAVNNAPWTSVSSSADRSVIIGASVSGFAGGQLTTSLDSGANWSSNAVPPKYWQSVACSADGTRLVAAADTSPSHPTNTGAIYVSMDSGSSWSPTLAPTNNWVAIACSADGTRLVAAAMSPAPPRIYTSTNSGGNWAFTSFSGTNRYAVASSADGGKLFTAVYGGGIYTLQSSVPPRLCFTASAGRLAFSWTVPSVDMVLQQNSDLTTTIWTDVTNAPTVTNLQNQVVLPLPTADSFYRLKQP